MAHLSRVFAAPLLAGLLGAAPAVAGTITQTNLVSDGTIPAAFTDPNAVNVWGISYAPGGAFWVSDNGTGLTTLYDGTGKPQSLVVTIASPPGGAGHSAPTGQVYNPTSLFDVTEAGTTGASAFIFATEDGTISGWAPSVDFGKSVIAVDNSATGAVYKGLALYTHGKTTLLFATNFRSGLVEVYDGTFKLVGTFRDTGGTGNPVPSSKPVAAIPADFAPYNVAVLNGHIYVDYAKQDAAKHDSISGHGLGYVDQVSTTGALVQRVASKGDLNAPWGLAIAPTGFGPYAGTLLVGNFGDGRIGAYNTSTGKLVGQLKTGPKTKLAIDGLWGIIPGNGGGAGSTSDIYFGAGPNGETHGLFGSLSYVP